MRDLLRHYFGVDMTHSMKDWFRHRLCCTHNWNEKTFCKGLWFKFFFWIVPCDFYPQNKKVKIIFVCSDPSKTLLDFDNNKFERIRALHMRSVPILFTFLKYDIFTAEDSMWKLQHKIYRSMYKNMKYLRSVREWTS